MTLLYHSIQYPGNRATGNASLEPESGNDTARLRNLWSLTPASGGKGFPAPAQDVNYELMKNLSR
jgi:hypothetical protein